jgi:hypothetical protein
MSWRFRRSRQILPGVRLNASKTGLGLSFGGRGARTSIHSSGRMTRSVGIPGTGVYWRRDSRWRGAAGSRRPASADAAAAPLARYPSWAGAFAATPAHQADDAATIAVLNAAATGDLAALIGLSTHPTVGPAAAGALAVIALGSGHYDVASHAIEGVTSTAVCAHPLSHRLMTGSAPFPIVPGCELEIPGDSALLPAIAHVLNRAGRYRAVIVETNGVAVDDAATAIIAIERARAFNGLQIFHAAKEAVAPVMRRTSLPEQVRAAALEQRALTNLCNGQTAPARNDIQRLMALDSNFPTLSTLQTLATS